MRTHMALLYKLIIVLSTPLPCSVIALPHCRPILLDNDDRRGGGAVTKDIGCHRVEGVGTWRKIIVGMPDNAARKIRTGGAGAAHGANKNVVTVDLNRAQPYVARRLHLDFCQVSKGCVIQWSSNRNSRIRNGDTNPCRGSAVAGCVTGDSGEGMQPVGGCRGVPRESVGRDRYLGPEVHAVELELQAGDAHVIGGIRGHRDRAGNCRPCGRRGHGNGRRRGVVEDRHADHYGSGGGSGGLPRPPCEGVGARGGPGGGPRKRGRGRPKPWAPASPRRV